MLQELRFQFSTAILTVLTIGAAIAAALNYQQIHRFRLPEDGAVWEDHMGKVVAVRLAPNGPTARAGIRVNDVLKTIQGTPIHTTEDVPKSLAYVGAWAKVTYTFNRGAVDDVKATVYVGEASRGRRALVPVPCWTVLSGDRLIYLFPAGQRAQSAALLHLLPGFVYLLLLPLHG